MPKPQLFRLLILAAAIGCSSSPSTSGGYSPATDLSNLCTTPLAPNEPLCSAAFGDTVWSGSHRASYAQGSSPFPGPSDSVATESAHLDLPGAGVPVIASISAPYEDGGRAVWSTVTGADAAIVKVDHETFEIIDWYVPGDREVDPPTFTLGLSGAYTAIDSENRFIVGRTRFVSFFGDSAEGDRLSPIELEKRIFMPDEVFCNENDVIAGMSLTYDGQLAFATELGNLFIIPSDADPNDLGDVPVISANQDCATADEADLEIVSNSVAVDENGGIYVLTSVAMYRFDWDGGTLSLGWRAEYQSAEEVPSPIRLGPGSGSTPSLMGTAADDDRFVVITDGLGLMNLVLFWRDEVPADWAPIAPGKDPRIACEIPIDFGTGATVAISEQSVAVRGYSAVVVNDLLSNPTINPPSMLTLGAVAQNTVSALEGGIPEKAPFGLERIDWDPETRSCATVWANSEISVPNGIPSISEASGLVYGAGQRSGQWGLEGLDFGTGESRVWVEAGPGACRSADTMILSILPGVADVLEVVPDSCENSFYAATTVGPDAVVYQGTLNGVTRYVPAASEQLPAAVQAAAGIDQALELLSRSESDAPSSIGERDYLRRAIAQLDATQTVALGAGLADVAAAAATAMESLDAGIAAFDAGDPYEGFVQAARAALSSI
ncbi:MAG: hypothetical protein HKN10_18690 [Myxococcales bacterium]|nr:hypothetical protein [Myxococcales bacterium]